MSKELKYTKENVELRRGKVLELSAQGYNQTEISKMLNVSEGLISIDMQYIRAQAKESIRSYIDEKLPEEYGKCLSGLNSILKESWTISYRTEDNTEKIKALSLAKECYNSKLDLLTNVTVVEDVIKFVNKGKVGTLLPNDSKGVKSFTPLERVDEEDTQQEPSPVSEEEPIQQSSEED